MVLTSGPRGADRRDTWHTDGYLLLRGVVPPDRCAALLAAPGRRAAGGPDDEPPARGGPAGDRPEPDQLVTAALGAVLGSGVAPAVSRLVVRSTGQRGTPWGRAADHRTVRPGQPATAWLSLTDAGLDNGCPWLLPGSHAEPPDERVPRRRSGGRAGGGTPPPILGVDTGVAVPVAMQPGDVLVVDGHLVHRWTDNHSTAPVAAVEWQLAG